MPSENYAQVFQINLSAGVPILSFRDLTSDEVLDRDNTSTIFTQEKLLQELYQSIQNSSDSEASSVPNWATWNLSQAQTWGNTNIGTPLADARTNLNALATLNLATFKAAMNTILDILDAMWTLQQKLAQMEIALRNKTWPNLQD